MTKRKIEDATEILLKAINQIRSANLAIENAIGIFGLSSTESKFRRYRTNPGESVDFGPLASMARCRIADRRLRDRVFENSAMFGEPVWEMLLDLFVARVDDADISVSSACIGSVAPATTALRYIRVLEQQGLLERVTHKTDARMVLVRLTDKAMRNMVEVLSRSKAFPPIPLEG